MGTKETEENSQYTKDKEINEIQRKCRQLSKMIENQDIRIDKWLNCMQEQINNLKVAINANVKDDSYEIQPSGYGYVSYPTEKSADEMFEELGYEKDTFDEFGASEVVYINNNKDNIIVRKNGHYIKYNYYDFHPDYDFNDIKFITEAEDKAIHKKVDELKENGK